MGSPQLTDSHRAAIAGFLPAFQEYLNAPEFGKDMADRADRVEFFQVELPKRLDGFSEADVDAVVTRLWASRIWGNKAYHVQKIISENGIEQIRDSFVSLLDGSRTEGERYERFLSEVKGLGPASVTEMLCYLAPARCGIWNRRAREALKMLGLDSFVNPDKYRLSGVEYQQFNAVLASVADELRGAGLAIEDLLFVDFFLYDVSKQTPIETPIPPSRQTFDHDEVRDLIESIGVMLGFDADKEVAVTHGARVDAVWRARIGNLGLVTYVFEVHKAGSMDSLLLNLQKAWGSPTVQKVIAVSDADQLEKISKESNGLPEEFRRALGLWLVDDVDVVAQSLERANDIIDQLGLVRDAF